MDHKSDMIEKIFDESIRAKKAFLDAGGASLIAEAAGIVADRLRRGGKILVFGNGGSAADSQHMAAELVVRFEAERKAVPCIALTTNTSDITAAANDYSFDKIFSRQIEALAVPDDVAIAISTSGNSPNVIEGVQAAKEKGAFVLALAGKDGGDLAASADLALVVKDQNTARVQETHILIIHALCKLIEEDL